MSLKNKLHNLLSSLVNEAPKQVFLSLSNVSYGDILRDKVVLVVGGSKGIGYTIAKRAVQEGAKVIVTGRSEHSLKEAVASIGNNASYIEYDNENIQARESFLDECSSIYGDIDCFVLNAGISFHEGNFSNVSVEGFEKQLKINLESTYFLIQAVIKRHTNNSRKINILVTSSETSAKYNDLPYGISKVAINSMIGGIARRVCQKGIRINGIAPGVTLTDMTSDKTNTDDLYYNSALGRYILPDEVANVALFLLSDASSCVNGEIMFCDGGNHLKINGFDNNYNI